MDNLTFEQNQKSLAINKLLIVGHTLSDYETVIDMLTENGVKLPQPLKKEGIDAAEISSILLKAHGFQSSNSAIRQLDVNPVWNGLAMDLMMSNIDTYLWAWADSAALPLLNYWKSLDSSLSFVLVYNTPERFVGNLLKKAGTCTPVKLQREIEHWFAYNRELLNFYYRNQESSLLVNAQQVQENSWGYLQEVDKQIGLDAQALDNDMLSVTAQNEEVDNNHAGTYKYLANKLISANQKLKQLHDEMQSVANLPLCETLEDEVSIFEAIGFYQEEQARSEATALKNKSQIQTLEEKLEKYYLDNSAKTEELQSLNNEINTLRKQLQSLQKKSKDRNESTAKIQNSSLIEENKLLLEQLHCVQEELEKYYLENENLKKKAIKPKQKHYGAADRVKRQLSYRLGAVMIDQSRSLSGSLTLLIALYRELRKFRKEQANRKKLPPIRTYADAHEADRVKKHLSYRLGQAIITSFKSPVGIVKLPFALKKAHKEYKVEKNMFKIVLE
jgi:polyhydroxyalkanoate synthesis regulator phasin